MPLLKILLPYSRLLAINYSKAHFLKNIYINNETNIKADMLIMEGNPQNFSGHFYSFEKLLFFQNFYRNYFYNPLKIFPFDYKLIISNWISYLISFLMKDFFLNIHGCLIQYKDKNYIFAGRSGSGKTTIAYYFLKKGGIVLSDEFSLIGGNETTYIPRPIYIRKSLTKENYHFQFSHILNGYFSKIDNKRNIEILPKVEKIFLLNKANVGVKKYFYFLLSLHTFDFYDEKYYKKIEVFFHLYKSYMEILQWRNLKELKNFVDTF